MKSTAERLLDWQNSGLGFDPGYAQSVMMSMTSDGLKAAAFEWVAPSE